MEQVKKRPELLHCNRSHNILKDLMFRDFGFLYYNCCKTKTRGLESIAEMNLVGKKHKELEYDLPGYPKATFLMVFSPDGTKIASAHGNHSVYITDVATRKNIKILSGHPRTPWCITFHPSSSHILASGCLGGQVRVWDLRDGSKVWNAESQTVIASLAFHPFEKLLVIATNNEIHFWDWSRSEPFAVISTKTNIEKVRYVAFDNLGRKLITGIGNDYIRESRLFRSRLRYGRMYNNQISNNYSETAQNETVQSFRTIEEPSHSTQSSLRDAVTVDSDVILPYICNWQTERRRGGLNLSRDDDERSFSDVSAVVRNFSGISGYRVQAWDFSKGEIPDITNSEKNIVIHKCKIRNDASINISSDGKLLATCFMRAAGVYSLQWETLGEEIYWTEVYNSVISVSISPTQEHLLVGLARSGMRNDYTMAIIYRLTHKQSQNDKPCIQDMDFNLAKYLHFMNSNKRNTMLLVRDLLQNNQSTREHTSINCIRWAPQPGQGLVYATNTGRLAILH
ncbi:activating molecule in BECN1-regulated autophagy protein 1-like isoform X2 [Apis laboriosa]|uniref:activating molecule in BECN1-regulated autophagy protein 1-like isoform X2 n=1 Tax=Apis laboriosa TaxID=183418 RepID=UPI001CC62C16|nr:activating molecule in BECN1-regulated autophagy protein 1-like isoform X2 [Apis laboriosa]